MAQYYKKISMAISGPQALKQTSLPLTSYSTMQHKKAGLASILILTGEPAELFSFPMVQCEQAQILPLSHTISTARLKDQQKE